jgi:glycosyltransferase involved in cell wall biosynthesis
MTIRVALNAAFLHRPDTGSGQYLIHLVAELNRPGYDVSPQLIEPPTDGNAAKLKFEQLDFPRAALAARADLAHVPYFGSALVPHVPTVVTIHDLIPVVLPLYRGSAKVRAYTRLVSLAARRAHAIIADSEASRRDIIKHLGIAPEKIRVVYLAADPSYRPVIDNSELPRVRAKYGLPEQFVLYFGGFDQRKNVPNLVRAFVKVAQGLGEDCSLVLAGRVPTSVSPLFPDVRALVNELDLSDQTCFIGAVAEADKPALYTLAACFAWPSYYEGFGLPVLEAMACGTPVVAGDAGSLPEIVADAGFLVPPDNINKLAGAIIASVIDAPLRAEHRARGLARAATFSWEKCALETVQVYKETLASR